MGSSENLDIKFVDLAEVPMYLRSSKENWKERFNNLPEGKAALVVLGNRQRAHQIRMLVVHASRYWKIPIATRIIHAQPEIHNTDGWLLYYWKKKEVI